MQCWDFMKCGHKKDASCPVVLQTEDKKCWLVVGTFCGGKVQGDYAQQFKSCVDCGYYKYMQGQEGTRNTGRGIIKKPRIIIYDDNTFVLKMVRTHFSEMNYEVQSFSEPIPCPPLENTNCCLNPCADIIITDFRMPRINGIELLSHQAQRGCPITVKNKAIMSEDLPYEHIDKIIELADIFFQKPLHMEELNAWTKECISRVDLSQPLANYFV